MTTVNNSLLINTVDDLHQFLVRGMMIEHSTLPPYLTALYSLKPGTNLEAFHILRSAAVEEMLHLTLVANVLNAVGGTIKGTLTDKNFVPQYPTPIPTGETDFKVGLEKFSHDSVDIFLKIERAEEIPEDAPLVVSRNLQQSLLSVPNQPDYSFYSIGLFYAEIIRALYALHKKMGDDLFSGHHERQITPEYYYNGGGEIIPVTDLRSAIRALKVIQEQGEGSRVEAVYDAEREISHYYRFQQLKLGQHYKVDKNNPENSDKPNHPTGEKFKVDWNAVYPIKPNAKLSDYPQGSELHEAGQQFQKTYSDFLSKIEYAFDGHPATLIPAVGEMFRLREQANLLIRNPIPGTNFNAAPIYRLD
ncbi:ferritin-like protein [Nostoc sp. C117]|uniref:ferritin-like domain-containing protein n=1 Tax=Nostoc sp. C117 TaxID=3349875 RepID=UPI00370D52BD